MKNLIDKITNEDRLLKLYGCEEKKGFYHPAHCLKCNGKGYAINRDSQVLDIIECLCEARSYDPEKYCPSVPVSLAQALIKLIELVDENFRYFSIDKSNVESYRKVYSDGSSLDSVLYYALQKLGHEGLEISTIELLLAICNHHNIDIWDSVKEILDSEEIRAKNELR